MKSFMQFLNEKTPLDADGAKEMLQEALGLLRGQYWNYWTSHWQARGPNYYGNHLLFSKLYEGIQAEIDALAEKIVSYFGEDAVDQVLITQKAMEYAEEWNKTKDPVARGIKSEKDFQKTFKSIYEALKTSDDLTLGLDDFLMATANGHETNLYLLGQVKN